jgi:hypothetical protein
MQATIGNAHGYRLSVDGRYTPLFSAPDEIYHEEFHKACMEYPYLAYNDEILSEIDLLCVTGDFFNRDKKEVWILDGQIRTLRNAPLMMHTDDAENFATAIEMFLKLQLLDDYDSTKDLFDKEEEL